MNIRKGLNNLGTALAFGGGISLVMSAIMMIVTMFQVAPFWWSIIASALCLTIGSFLEGATS